MTPQGSSFAIAPLKPPANPGDLQLCDKMRSFNKSLRECAVEDPSRLDALVLAQMKVESAELVNSPVLKPWVQDILNADSLALATSKVLARKICGAEAGLEMDIEVGGLNQRVDYLIPLFEKALQVNEPCMSLDLLAIATKDPAVTSYLQPFLFFKGFHATALQRIGHQLWVRSGDNADIEELRMCKPRTETQRGHRTQLASMITAWEAHYTALWLQCRCSEVFGVDMHPGARIGKGLFMDHATGIVVGETATVGDHVSILHSVTLGGTGKATKTALRHPQIGDGVVIGSCASVLGDIHVGHGATIGAQAVVTKPVLPNSTVIGLNQVLTAKQEKEVKKKGSNDGTWWAETGGTYILTDSAPGPATPPGTEISLNQKTDKPVGL